MWPSIRRHGLPDHGEGALCKSCLLPHFSGKLLSPF